MERQTWTFPANIQLRCGSASPGLAFTLRARRLPRGARRSCLCREDTGQLALSRPRNISQTRNPEAVMCPITQDHPLEDSNRGALGTPRRKALIRGVRVQAGGLFCNSSGLHARWLSRGLSKLWLWVQPSPVPAVNKLLEPSHAHLFTPCLWRFCSARTQLSSCDRDQRPCKAESVSCLALCGKLADSCSNACGPKTIFS